MGLIIGDSSLQRCLLIGFKEQVPAELLSFKNSIFFFLSFQTEWMFFVFCHPFSSKYSSQDLQIEPGYMNGSEVGRVSYSTQRIRVWMGSNIPQEQALLRFQYPTRTSSSWQAVVQMTVPGTKPSLKTGKSPHFYFQLLHHGIGFIFLLQPRY